MVDDSYRIDGITTKTMATEDMYHLEKASFLTSAGLNSSFVSQVSLTRSLIGSKTCTDEYLKPSYSTTLTSGLSILTRASFCIF